MDKILEEFVFTEKEKSFIDGLLVSDGFIQKSNKCFGICTASKQFAEYVKNNLPNHIWANSGISKEEYFDKRTNKTYTRYRLLSRSNVYFERERERWYDENGKKEIPSDFKIDATVLLMWYLGDGCLQQRKSKNITESIKLCTNSFPIENIENTVLPWLQVFDATLSKTERNQYVIRIPRKKVDAFLSYIGEPPFSDYEHKWAVYPYKNKNIEKNGIKNISEEIAKTIVEEYINGEIASRVAKKYNLDVSLVIYYCKKAGVYVQGRDRITYKVNKSTGEEWIIHNLKKFCEEQKICYTNMQKLCWGKIRKYRDYKIVKI